QGRRALGADDQRGASARGQLPHKAAGTISVLLKVEAAFALNAVFEGIIPRTGLVELAVQSELDLGAAAIRLHRDMATVEGVTAPLTVGVEVRIEAVRVVVVATGDEWV